MDTWTTQQMVYTFACTIGSFINDDWELIECVVDFKPLNNKEHQGTHAGLSFINSARQHGGLDKICCFRCAFHFDDADTCNTFPA